MWDSRRAAPLAQSKEWLDRSRGAELRATVTTREEMEAEYLLIVCERSFEVGDLQIDRTHVRRRRKAVRRRRDADGS